MSATLATVAAPTPRQIVRHLNESGQRQPCDLSEFCSGLARVIRRGGTNTLFLYWDQLQRDEWTPGEASGLTAQFAACLLSDRDGVTRELDRYAADLWERHQEDGA
jgi:hypothetical protein